MNANTTAPGDDRAAANPESATATPATIPADGAQNRDSSGAEPNAAARPKYSTRQFDLGNGRRLVDMRGTRGGVEIIPEAPGVSFDGLPTMSRDEAIRAALDCPGVTDAARVALVREIVTTGADGGDAIR